MGKALSDPPSKMISRISSPGDPGLPLHRICWYVPSQSKRPFKIPIPDVTAVGALGNDEMGNILVEILNRYGVKTQYLARKDGVQTSGSILPIRPNGERPALHVMGANAVFSFEDVPHDLIATADFVHIGGFYLMPKFDGPDTVKALKLAKESDAITTMDILGVKQENMAEKILPCMPYLDYFMPNLEEAGMITGLSDPDEMCQFFLNAGAKNVVLKMGERGSLILGADGTRIRMPAFQVKLVDTTGCGDAWSAGFVAGLSRGMSVTDAAPTWKRLWVPCRIRTGVRWGNC